MENNSENIFQKLKKELVDYVELKISYLKISSVEQAGRVTSALCYTLIWIFLLFFINLFIFIALGFYLGTLFKSLGLGFACIAAFYIVVLGLIYLKKASIKRLIENIVYGLLMEDDITKENKHE